MNGKTKFAVGGGSWATAIKKCYVNLSEVSWYMRNETAIAPKKNTNTILTI
jgi:glycerol-3-phosphate dehydrogenase (NAD(P)+)